MSIETQSLAALAGSLRAGKIKARDLCEAAIERHEARGANLNAYREWAPERARVQADAADQAFAAGRDLGPLQGIPQSIKDNYGVPGYDTYAGTPRKLPEKWREAGSIVSKVQRQAGVVMGKSHMVEFALGTLGSNPHWPTPVNPWDRRDHRAPGGSSSGAGVTIGEGSALVAWGSDTAGSIRCPAGMTGCVGYKATNLRWPTDGIVPLSPLMDVPGPLVRSAADLAFVWAAIEDEDAEALPPVPAGEITIGVADDFFWADASPGVAETVEAAIEELARTGAKIVAAEIPTAAEAYALAQIGGLAAYQFCRFIEGELPEWEALASPWIVQRIAAGRDLSESDFEARRARVDNWHKAAADSFNACDVIVSPTTPITPPRLADIETPEAFRDASLINLRNTTVANLLDLPAVTLPAGLDAAGLPVGLQVMAPSGDDRTLIGISQGIEAVLGAPADRIGVPQLP